MMASSLFDQVSRETKTHDDDGAFWWGMFGQSLATLLNANQYGEDEQLYYLRFLRQWVVRALGPRPVAGKPYFPATLTYDGSPLELSLNWKEKVGQTVRFTTEPSTEKAGTAADPMNQLAAQSLLTAMAKDVPGIDLTRFHLFLEATGVPDAAAEEVWAKFPPLPRCRVLLAYDLEKGAIGTKAYFNPVHRAIFQGTSTKTVVFDAIRKCNGPYGSYDVSVEALDACMSSNPAPDGPQIFLLAHDCVPDSAASRNKVYVSFPTTSLAAALDAFSLGGRLTGSATEAGLEAIKSFWCHLFGLDPAAPDVMKDVLPAGNRCSFVYEMRPSPPDRQDPNIEVKMHMPASWLGETDAEVSQVLSTWFQKHSSSDLAARYQSDLASTL